MIKGLWHNAVSTSGWTVAAQFGFVGTSGQLAVNQFEEMVFGRCVIGGCGLETVPVNVVGDIGCPAMGFLKPLHV